MKSMITAAAVAAFAGSAFAGTIAFHEDFEGAAQWTSATSEFSDTFGDFWGNSATTTWGTFVEYFGADGNYFAGMDLDGEGASLPITQTFNSFSISGLTDITISVDLAEDQDGTNEDWDDGVGVADFVDFEYQIDGGAWTNVFSVLAIDDPGTEFNQAPGINGDAAFEITDTFETFTFDLAGVSGSSMAVRAIWNLNSGDEDLAIDNVLVTGVPVPAPGSAALFGLAGFAASRRRRA